MVFPLRSPDPSTSGVPPVASGASLPSPSIRSAPCSGSPGHVCKAMGVRRAGLCLEPAAAWQSRCPLARLTPGVTGVTAGGEGLFWGGKKAVRQPGLHRLEPGHWHSEVKRFLALCSFINFSFARYGGIWVFPWRAYPLPCPAPCLSARVHAGLPASARGRFPHRPEIGERGWGEGLAARRWAMSQAGGQPAMPGEFGWVNSKNMEAKTSALV